VQVDPITPTLKAPGTKSLNQTRIKLLSSLALKSKSRRYIQVLLEERSRARAAMQRRGLTLVHFSAQCEPFLTQNTT